jgi:hypothetical protein
VLTFKFNSIKESKVNEPAFPNEGFNGWGEPFQGMTLRDYFAAKAMQAMLTKDTLMLLGNRGVTMLEVADRAYEMADAMMEARNVA